MKIGSTIKNLRKQNHLTQYQLAKELQMSRTTITNYENDYSSPDLDTLVALANYFHVSTDYLLSNQSAPNMATIPEKAIGPADREQLRFWHYFNRLNMENQDLIIGNMIQMFKEQK